MNYFVLVAVDYLQLAVVVAGYYCLNLTIVVNGCWQPAVAANCLQLSLRNAVVDGYW